MSQTRKVDAFYIDNNGQFPFDPDLPYVVVGVDNELSGRFPNKVAAEMFLEYALEYWGRIIDTTRTTEEAIEIYKERFWDFTPWVWKPQWYWHGWKTLIPFFVGHDEYARRTLCIGWTITGRIIFPLWYCGSDECLRESLEAIQNGDYDG